MGLSLGAYKGAEVFIGALRIKVARVSDQKIDVLVGNDNHPYTVVEDSRVEVAPLCYLSYGRSAARVSNNAAAAPRLVVDAPKHLKITR